MSQKQLDQGIDLTTTTPAQEQPEDLAQRIAWMRAQDMYEPDHISFVERWLPTFVVQPEIHVTRADIEACRYWGSIPDFNFESLHQHQLLEPGFNSIYHLALLVGLLDRREVEDSLVQSFMAIRPHEEIVENVLRDRFKDRTEVLLRSPDLKSYLTNILEEQMQRFQ